MIEVSIVVPMYRTAPTLVELHGRIRSALSNESHYEVIYVDDGCDQGSGAALETLARTHGEVVTTTHPVNVGQHHAIRTGLGLTKGSTIVVLDGDLQDPPEAIPILVARLREGDVDAVFAGRLGNYQSIGRLQTGRSFKWVLNKLAGTPIDAGGFVAMSRELVDDLLVQDLPSPYLLAGIGSTKRRCVSVPIERLPRPVGFSATSSATRMRLGIGALRTTWRSSRR